MDQICKLIVSLFQSLNHNNIVNILGYSWKPDVMIVMEYLEEGSLNYYLKFQGDKLAITHLLIYARDIATVSVTCLPLSMKQQDLSLDM